MIEYDISYIDNNIDEKIKGILPKSMKMYYNNELAINHIDGFMGLYSISQFYNMNSGSTSTLLKVFDKYYLHQGEKGENVSLFDIETDLQIEETYDTFLIAGLLSKKVIVNNPALDESYDILYTEMIELNNPNFCNPYHMISGVLTKFEMQMQDLRMQFTAINFSVLNSSISLADIPDNAIEVNREQMNQIISRLME